MVTTELALGGLAWAVWHAAWWAWAVVAAAGLLVGGIAALAAPRLGSAAFQGATWGGGAAVGAALLLAAGWHLRQRRTA